MTSIVHASLACAAIALASSHATAQLVFGSTTTNTSNPGAMYLDVNTLQVTTLWNSAANKKVNGLASDPVTHRLYANDAASLNYWDYGNLGTAPDLRGNHIPLRPAPPPPAAATPTELPATAP